MLYIILIWANMQIYLGIIPFTGMNIKFLFINIVAENVNWDNLDSAYEVKSGQHKNIPEFCRRHVKPKKQHEIFRMGQVIFIYF